MTYGKFAYLYDELMNDAPYEQWVSFVLKSIEQMKRDTKCLLDLGCGTGNVSIPLAQHRINVTAVDLSEEMLFVAKEKSEQAEVEIDFFQQDMRELEGLGQFDTVISLCDSLNYLENEEEVEKTFQNVYDHLQLEGFFLFDVHSTFKVKTVFSGNTFAYNGEDISYIWESFSGEEPLSVEHDLSFFVKNEKGLYERYNEFHKQRTYPLETYKKMLENSGFKVVSITGDFSTTELKENAERWFFVAQK